MGRRITTPTTELLLLPPTRRRPHGTLMRATLVYVEEAVVGNRNITLSLPEEDLKRAKVIAVQRGTSLSQLLASMIKDLSGQETGYALAKARSLALLEQGQNLGTEGQIHWGRDELHER